MPWKVETFRLQVISTVLMCGVGYSMFARSYVGESVDALLDPSLSPDVACPQQQYVKVLSQIQYGMRR